MRVAIVGAGFGGLSAACHLAGRGHEVVVVDREQGPGGRVRAVQQNGYTLDLGATVLTMVNVLEDVFEAAGASMENHLELAPLDPMYRATFPDQEPILLRHGVEAMESEIREKCGAPEAAAFRRFCGWLTELYRLEMPNFIDRNFDSPLDLARPPSPLLRLVRAGGLRRLSAVVEGTFADERLRRLFSFQSMYAGLSPFDALAIYAVITYMDTVEGVYFPKGGMAAIGRALAAAAGAAGAELRYGTPVERVLRSRSGAVRGLVLEGGDRLTADAVVANPDLPVAYRDLVPDVRPPRAARRGEYSPSCALWVAGVRGALPAEACHHNIHFGRAWREAFDALLRQGRRMPDPSILVTSHSFSDPGLAPPGGATLYVLEPVPNLAGTVDWAAQREACRGSLVDAARKYGYPVDDVEAEVFLDPRDWEQMGMERGTPFGLSHRFFQTGPFRPANRDRRVPGLFFVGSSTVPGVGVPMVLLSGRLAAERVERYRP